jgi:hypothetical protein
LFFFFEAVGLNAGKGFDQAGFTVIDVAGSTEYDVFHRRYPFLPVLEDLKYRMA